MNDFVFTSDTKDVVVARLLRFLDRWPESKPCQVTVKRFVKDRTTQQNKALFGLAYKILRDETGHSLDDLHDFFCRRYFGVHQYEVLGAQHSRPLRTTTTDENGKHDVMPWDQFAEFFSMVQTFAAEELCVHIPDPDPDWKSKAEAA